MFERNLSEKFLSDLKQGHLAPLLNAVLEDDELDLKIRNNYINIYYRGASIMKLTDSGQYACSVSPEYAKSLGLPDKLPDASSTAAYLNALPLLKHAVLRYQNSIKNSPEGIAEQELIRASRARNADFFWIDRQLADTGAENEADLIGVFWKHRGRNTNRVVDAVIGEVKYGENRDIAQVVDQISGYAERARASWLEFHSSLSKELRILTIELGMFPQSELGTVTIRDDPSSMVLLVVLVDYNPYSTLLDSDLAAKVRERTGCRCCVHRINNALFDKDFASL